MDGFRFGLYSISVAHGLSSDSGDGDDHYYHGHRTDGGCTNDIITTVDQGSYPEPEHLDCAADGEENAVRSFVLSVVLLNLKHGTQSVSYLPSSHCAALFI